MCIRDRDAAGSDQAETGGLFTTPGRKKDGPGRFDCEDGLLAVSYTHLDVYKRQGHGAREDQAGKGYFLIGDGVADFIFGHRWLREFERS